MTKSLVLVTGAGGFVCSEICAALVRAGHAVVGVDRVFDAPTRARLGGVRMVEGTVTEVLADISDITPAAVIHGAAITASPERLDLTHAGHIRRNVEMHTATLDWARNAGAGQFLFLSSMGVFEPNDAPAQGGCFTEATVPTATCTYSAAKQAGELLTASAAEPGFATLSLRLGNIFGPHEAVRDTRQILCLVSRMIAQARETRVITVDTPEARREWSWLPDLADKIAVLIGEFPDTAPSVRHAGTPPPQTDLAVARAIADRMRNTSLRLVSPPHMTIRPPMASEHPDHFGCSDWTPMDKALEHLISSGDSP